MLLKKKNHHGKRLAGSIVSGACKMVVYFCTKFYQPLPKYWHVFLLRICTFFVMLTLLLIVDSIFFFILPKRDVALWHNFWYYLKVYGVLSLLFIMTCNECFPVFIPNHKIISLWQQDHAFFNIGKCNDGGTVNVIENTQNLLLAELLSGELVADIEGKQQEILKVCSQKLNAKVVTPGEKRYTILPAEPRYRLPTADDMYWVDDSMLKRMQDEPLFIYKFLRVGVDFATVHFKVFEIQAEDKAMVFEGNIQYGDEQWKKSKYVASLFYEGEMPVTIIPNRQRWSAPVEAKTIYIGM